MEVLSGEYSEKIFAMRETISPLKPRVQASPAKYEYGVWGIASYLWFCEKR